ncbi:unnamed protein product [Adineta ricciae]|uniref:G-protein coupled receptors family 1 profile domain-containing protein n=1 Tax=Adineta ricciae TaxID=249248 RepID=A0A813MG98_ADIRI|nr:unnamed protein product [Adineta ricciae]CAF1101140.1 unnamed protein product [Adineta ricciae]
MNDVTYVQWSRYTQPVLILFGTFGAIFNQILFHRRKLLRTASCSLYFRVISINDLLVLYIIVFTQWLNDQFHFDLTVRSAWHCKIRTYATYCLYAISPYCIVLVCIDRFCRTSKYSRVRTIATLRTAHRLIFVIISLICSLYIHILFQFNIIEAACRPSSLSYYRFLGHFLVVFYCLLPPILMTVFSSWTLILLSSRRRKQIKKYQIKTQPLRKRRFYRDYQLIKVLVLYVSTNIICTLPFSFLILLDVYQANLVENPMLYIKYSVLLCNLNHCTSFFIYTLGTPLYRRELIRLIQSIRKRFRM